jgi:hypothetical protein
VDTNGDGPKLDTYQLQPEVTAFVDALITENPALADHRDSLFRLAGFSASRGFAQAKEDLRKRTIPVTLTEPLTGYAELEGEEAAAFLASLGIASDDGNGHKQP